MEDIGRQLDQRQAEIETMKEQFDRQEEKNETFINGLDPETKELLKDNVVTQPFESKIRHMLDEETE